MMEEFARVNKMPRGSASDRMRARAASKTADGNYVKGIDIDEIKEALLTKYNIDINIDSNTEPKILKKFQHALLIAGVMQEEATEKINTFMSGVQGGRKNNYKLLNSLLEPIYGESSNYPRKISDIMNKVREVDPPMGGGGGRRKRHTRKKRRKKKKSRRKRRK